MKEPNTIESLLPTSGQYSFRQDLRLSGWLAVAVVVYLVEHYAAVTVAGWSPLARGLAGLAPIVPGLLYVRSWVRFVRGMDEFQRRIQVEVFLFAALVALVLGTVLSTLSARGVPLGPLQHGLTLGWLFMVLIVLWLARTVVVLARYK
jgi:hypothetical protein